MDKFRAAFRLGKPYLIKWIEEVKANKEQMNDIDVVNKAIQEMSFRFNKRELEKLDIVCKTFGYDIGSEYNNINSLVKRLMENIKYIVNNEHTSIRLLIISMINYNLHTKFDSTIHNFLMETCREDSGIKYIASVLSEVSFKDSEVYKEILYQSIIYKKYEVLRAFVESGVIIKDDYECNNEVLGEHMNSNYSHNLIMSSDYEAFKELMDKGLYITFA